FEDWVGVLVAWLAVDGVGGGTQLAQIAAASERVASLWSSCGPAGTEVPPAARLSQLSDLRSRLRDWAVGPVPAAKVPECLPRRPGEVGGSGSRLIRLGARTDPDINDPEIRERALRHVIADVVARKAAGRLRKVAAW